MYRAKFFVRWFLLLLALTACKSENNTSNQNTQNDRPKLVLNTCKNSNIIENNQFTCQVLAEDLDPNTTLKYRLNTLPMGMTLYLKIQAQIDQGHIYINGYEHDSINLPYKREIDNTESHYLIDPKDSSKYFGRLMFYDSVNATLMPFHGFLETDLDLNNDEKESLKGIVPLPADGDVLFKTGTFFVDGYPVTILCPYPTDSTCAGVNDPDKYKPFKSKDKNNIFAQVHISYIEKDYSTTKCSKYENYVAYKGNNLFTGEVVWPDKREYIDGRLVNNEGQIISPNDADINSNPCNRID